MVHGADAALHRVESTLPRGFPEQVWTTISRGVLSQRERFLAGRDAARWRTPPRPTATINGSALSRR